jgi:Cupin-like domain
MAEIPRCHQPTPDEFRERYALPGLPVILTGLTDHWAARHWTPQGMAGRFPQATIDVTPPGSTVEGTRSSSLADYVQAVESGHAGGDYLTSWCFRTDCPELLEDFDIPVYFQEDWLEELPEKNDMMWLFLGAAGSGMGMHQDLGHTAAWNAQVTGLKKWALVAPEYEDYLYGGKVCAFKPNRVRHSKFRRAEVLYGDVRAGEVLFIPGAWWHQTQNLETGFAITANFVNETNFRTVLACLEDAGEEELFHSLNEIAKRKVEAWT